MTIYFLVLLFLIMLSYIDKQLKTGGKLFAILSYILLFGLYVMRSWDVGFDTHGYIQYFNVSARDSVLHSYMEPLWVIINKAIYTEFGDFRIVAIVVALLGMSPFFVISKRLSYNWIFSIILYYMFCDWFNLMNQERCQIAICLCMISFYYLYKRKYIWSVVIVLFAYTIHNSALVFILFIAFDMIIKQYTKKIFLLFGFAVGFILVFYGQLYAFLTSFFYTTYTTESSLIRETHGGNLKMFIMFFLLLSVILYLKYMNKGLPSIYTNNNNAMVEQDERLDKLLITAILFSLSLQLISVNNGMIARFANYFTIYFTILIPNTVKKIKSEKLKNQYKVLFFLIALAYMIISLRFSENGAGRDGVIPYKFFWQ